MKRNSVFVAALLIFAVLNVPAVSAIEVTERLTIEGDLSGAYQHQSVSDAEGYEDTGRGAVTFQPVITFKLTEKDVIQAKFGFAAGNALNDGTAPFNIAPWAAVLEQDVKGINGRDRDYLLTAWYGHQFTIGAGSLDLIGGIVDATDYLDENVYANDELTQFMNSAMVNGPNSFLPSFDLGGAALWESGNWSARAVFMSVAENADGRSFEYYGAQLAYKLDLSMGEGNYRLVMNGTSNSFSGPNGETDEARYTALISCDQQFGDTFGAWIRLGRQADDAVIEYQNLISGGLDIKGGAWAREQDNIGIGLAFLDGGNSQVQESNVLEVYYRFALNEFAAFTLDFQYLYDDLGEGNEPKGIISGMRFTASF